MWYLGVGGLPSGGDAILRTPSRPARLEGKARRRGLRGTRGVGSYRLCRPEDGLEHRRAVGGFRAEGDMLCRTFRGGPSV